MKPWCRALAATALLGSASCGYRVIDPSVGGGRRVSVAPASNDTRWRGIETGLTRSLRTDFERLLDVRLGGDESDFVLKTGIRDVSRGAPDRARTGGALVGSATLEVTWRLEDPLGEVLGNGKTRRTLEFLPSDGEDALSAMGEILDTMAEQVVIEVSILFADSPAPGS